MFKENPSRWPTGQKSRSFRTPKSLVLGARRNMLHASFLCTDFEMNPQIYGFSFTSLYIYTRLHNCFLNIPWFSFQASSASSLSSLQRDSRRDVLSIWNDKTALIYHWGMLKLTISSSLPPSNGPTWVSVSV